jgi:hypothetical protein
LLEVDGRQSIEYVGADLLTGLAKLV